MEPVFHHKTEDATWAQFPNLLCRQYTGRCSRFGQSELATPDLKLGSRNVKEQGWQAESALSIEFSGALVAATLTEGSCVQANSLGGAVTTISAQIISAIGFGGLFLAT